MGCVQIAGDRFGVQLSQDKKGAIYYLVVQPPASSLAGLSVPSGTAVVQQTSLSLPAGRRLQSDSYLPWEAPEGPLGHAQR